MLDRVEKWRPVVLSELSKVGYPLPPELVLAVMLRESGGRAGAVNPSSGASGLMQVMPISLKWFNQKHGTKHTMQDLQGKSPRSARIQIRMGIWILGQFWRSAYKYIKKRVGEVALDDLARIADTFYAAGPGNATKRLDQVKPIWELIAARFPNWDRIKPAELVWTRATESGANWDLNAIDSWLSGAVIIDKKKAISGALVGLLAIALAWLYFKRKGK